MQSRNNFSRRSVKFSCLYQAVEWVVVTKYDKKQLVFSTEHPSEKRAGEINDFRTEPGRTCYDDTEFPFSATKVSSVFST